MSRSVFLSRQRRQEGCELAAAQEDGREVALFLEEERVQLVFETQGSANLQEMLSKLDGVDASEALLGRVSEELQRVEVSDLGVFQAVLDRLSGLWIANSPAFGRLCEVVAGQLQKAYRGVLQGLEREPLYRRTQALSQLSLRHALLAEESFGYGMFLWAWVPFCGASQAEELKRAVLRLSGRAFSRSREQSNGRLMAVCGVMLRDFFQKYEALLDEGARRYILTHVVPPRGSVAARPLGQIASRILEQDAPDSDEGARQFAVQHFPFFNAVIFSQPAKNFPLAYLYLSFLKDPTATAAFVSRLDVQTLDKSCCRLLAKLLQTVLWKPEDAQFLLPILDYLQHDAALTDWIARCGIPLDD